MNDLLLPAVQKGATTPTVDTDPYYNLVSLHLKGDVNTGRNYNAFSDASSNNFRLTNNGDVRGSSLSPFNSSWSNYFNGSYLTVPAGADFNLGTNDFCIEFWLNPIAPATYGGILSFDSNGDFPLNFSYASANSSNLQANFGTSAAPWLFTANFDTSTATNAWAHYVATRSGSTFRLFKNGVLKATGTNTGTIGDSSGNIYINGNSSSAGTTYISNLRIINGSIPTAYQTSSTTTGTTIFTVPTSPLTTTSQGAIAADVKLLTCQSNRFVDNSTANPKTISVVAANNTPTISPFAPFVETDTTSGSGYFDGTGDYLSGNTNLWATTTSTFTVDGWVYPTSVPGAKNMLLGDFSPTGATLYFAIYINSSRQVVLEWYDGTTKNCTSTSTINLNEWSYVAVRVSSNAIAMYVNSATASGLTGTTTLTNRSGTTNWALGQYANQYNWNGYISNIRMSTVARTIAIPTAPFTPDADTKLLTLQERGAYNTIGFEDDSENDFPITRSGNVAQGTFSPFSNAGWSGYFDGTGDYLTIPDNAAFDLAAGDFLIETFVYNQSSTNFKMIMGQWNTGQVSYTLRQNASKWVFTYTTNGTTEVSVTGTSNQVLNAWTHLAVIRTGNTLGLFVNGTRETTASMTGVTIHNNTGVFSVGAAGNGGDTWVGYIGSSRLVKTTLPSGYDATLTTCPVPTAPFSPTATTSVIVCQSNRFVDNSNNNFTITRNGDTTAAPFSPFRGPVYDPVLHGGSAYFDGTSDFLNTPATGQFVATGDFTIQFWFYLTSLAAQRHLIGNYTSTSATDWLFEVTTAGVLQVFLDGSTLRLSHPGITTGQWYFVRVSRSGSTVTGQINGANFGTTATYTTSATIGSATKAVYLGMRSGSSNPMLGYMSGIALVPGSVLTGVPTAPTIASPGANLLLNFTNGGVIDSTGENVIETVGNAGVVTTTIKKYGSGSLFFDGTTDYLAVPDSRNFDFGSSDWTIEFWIYRTATAVQTLITKRTSNASAGIPNIFANASNKIVVECSGQTALTPTGTISNNTWTHVAIERYGSGANNVKIYFDGVADATSVSWTAMTSNTSPLYIGSDTNGNAYTGHLDDIRITRGLARYKGNFNPPTKALPDRGTTDQASYELGAPSGVEALVVGGGGGGASRYGGGGGAGGFREFVGGNAVSVAAATNYPISVGNGGAGTTDTAAVYYGAKGGDSRFAALVASGGGGGGGQTNYSTLTSADMAGGSGGGSSWGGTPATGGAGTAGQGNNGGSAASASQFVSAGGGGAGAPGSAATTSASAGGIGLQSSITGIQTYYAGGGGGGAFVGSGVGGAGGAGGLGGGGAGWGNSAGSAGTANTGGGGGGGSGTGGGGNGGSGVVILAYPTSFRPLRASVGLTFTIDTVTRPGYRVYRFTAGSGTISW